jgi:hypothetical protein
MNHSDFSAGFWDWISNNVEQIPDPVKSIVLIIIIGLFVLSILIDSKEFKEYMKFLFADV